jgi:hypothetical protein
MSISHRPPSTFLFANLADHYSVAYTKDTSGAKVPAQTLVKENIACFIQNARAQVIAEYSKRQEEVEKVLYTLDGTAFDAIDIEDRIVFDSVNYEVIGMRDPDNFSLFYRIDLRKEF